MKKNVEINKNIKIIRRNYREDINLEEEIQKSKIEAKKNSIPLNYIKIDEKISTIVYKIPINMRILREPNNNNYSDKIKQKLNTNNNDKSHENKLKNNFLQIKPFSSLEIGYRYYNQQLNKTSKIKRRFINSRMNISDNFDNGKNNTESLIIKRRCQSPTNSVNKKRLNSPFYQKYLNKSRVLNNKNYLLELNHPNNISNSFNKRNLYYNYNINNYHRTKNYNNNSNNGNKRIKLDNNSLNYYSSLNNSHIFHSPKAKYSQRILDDSENKKININYKKLYSEKIHQGIESTLSKNRVKFYKNACDNNKINKGFHINDKINDLYFQVNHAKNNLKNEKISNIGITPLHSYEFGNSLIKNNKKIYLKAPPIKGKLFRIYMNNDKSCRMCLINEEKKRKLSPIHFI